MSELLNAEAEQRVLGAMFCNNKLYQRIARALQPPDFGNALHARIFEAAGKLISEGRAADPVTMKLLFDQDQALKSAGGAKYLIQLAAAAPLSDEIDSELQVIADLKRRRELIAAAEAMLDDARSVQLDRPAGLIAKEHATRITEAMNGHRGAELEVLDLTTLQDKPVPPLRWLVPWWIPWGRVTGLYGAGGEGKTLLIQQLMTATALGRQWLGLDVAPVKSFGIFCEDDADEVHRRQADINQLYGCEFRDLGNMRIVPRLGYENVLMTFDERGKPHLTDLWWQLLEEAKDFGAQLFAVDTVADVFGGNEIDRVQVRAFVQMGLGGFARGIDGVTIAAAHPSRAGREEGYSGSTGWEFTMRSKCVLGRPKAEDGDQEQTDPNQRLLSRNKSNYGPRDEQLELFWRNGVFEHKPQPTGIFRTIDRNHADRVFMQLLDRFTAKGRFVTDSANAPNYAPRMFAKQPDAEGYKRGDFIAAMERLFHRGQIQRVSYRYDGHDKFRIEKQANVVEFPA